MLCCTAGSNKLSLSLSLLRNESCDNNNKTKISELPMRLVTDILQTLYFTEFKEVLGASYVSSLWRLCLTNCTVFSNWYQNGNSLVFHMVVYVVSPTWFASGFSTSPRHRNVFGSLHRCFNVFLSHLYLTLPTAQTDVMGTARGGRSGAP